jgi:hypothetical protein
MAYQCGSEPSINQMGSVGFATKLGKVQRLATTNDYRCIQDYSNDRARPPCPHTPDPKPTQPVTRTDDDRRRSDSTHWRHLTRSTQSSNAVDMHPASTGQQYTPPHLLDAFPHIRGMETINPALANEAWVPPFEIRIPDTAEPATSQKGEIQYHRVNSSSTSTGLDAEQTGVAIRWDAFPQCTRVVTKLLKKN